MFARFRAADYQFAAEKFLVVQFLHCPLGFLDRLHRDEGETFGALIVAIAHDLSVLHVTNPVKEFEEITLGRVEGQIADVETRRRDFDGFGWTLRPRFAVPFAFVSMQTIEEAKRAVEELHDKEFLGRKLVVSGAKSSEHSHD